MSRRWSKRPQSPASAAMLISIGARSQALGSGVVGMSWPAVGVPAGLMKLSSTTGAPASPMGSTLAQKIVPSAATVGAEKLICAVGKLPGLTVVPVTDTYSLANSPSETTKSWPALPKAGVALKGLPVGSPTATFETMAPL